MLSVYYENLVKMQTLSHLQDILDIESLSFSLLKYAMCSFADRQDQNEPSHRHFVMWHFEMWQTRADWSPVTWVQNMSRHTEMLLNVNVLRAHTIITVSVCPAHTGTERTGWVFIQHEVIETEQCSALKLSGRFGSQRAPWKSYIQHCNLLGCAAEYIWEELQFVLQRLNRTVRSVAVHTVYCFRSGA